ncbi:hypothetical protein GGR16_002654 [Chelatococcus caeni]|uniref:DUF2815 family protein n=1 Tax=Chelatococcus caeni TaxID=1348468 RepID=A0A840BXC4_9HYPH|nr:ssDNA-binding protein [Chelatococcus caeni]MBB4017620.1 hypothetical protein [Chelatococcus caeni]
MAINPLVCRISQKTGNIITPRIRMVYPALFKPWAPRGSDQEPKFQLTILVPKAADIALLKKGAQDAAFAEFGKDAKGVKTPFIKTEEQERFADYADEYPTMIRARSNERPGVADREGKDVFEDRADEVYGGRWAFVSLRPYAWKHPTGGKGVSFGLQNVQLLEDDEPIGGGRVAASSEFEPVEGIGGDDSEDAASLFV